MDMNAIIKAIGKTPSLATLPLRVEEGYLPALLTQSGGAMRALGAAMLRRETDRPLFVLCTDETNAGTLAADLEALLGESAVQLTGRDTVVLAGGVAANSHLRAELSEYCKTHGLRLCMAPRRLCGDNAAMVGAQAYYEYLAGNRADLTLAARAAE